MATATAPLPGTAGTEIITQSHALLSRELRRLTRAATIVALMTSPSRLLVAAPPRRLGVGEGDLRDLPARHRLPRRRRASLVRRVIPWPSLFGTDDARLREEDIVNRRRAWTWRFFSRDLPLLRRSIVTIVYLIQLCEGRAGREHHLVRRARHRPPIQIGQRHPQRDLLGLRLCPGPRSSSSRTS